MWIPSITRVCSSPPPIPLQPVLIGKCANETGLAVAAALGECVIHVNEWPGFEVDVTDFESALVNAVDHSGHNLRHRKHPTRPDPTADSGWTR